jgi:hypothetical protein
MFTSLLYLWWNTCVIGYRKDNTTSIHSTLRWGLIVRFVDIGENVNHHCLPYSNWYNMIMSEWVSDCCLTPIQQFYSYIMAINKLIFNEMMKKSALYWTNTLSSNPRSSTLAASTLTITPPMRFNMIMHD